MLTANKLDEALRRLKAQYHYSDETLESLKQDLIQQQTNELLNFKHTPVSIETFLTDSFFLGNITKDSWPKAIDSVIEIVEGKYTEVILTGSTGRSKNTRANWILAYNLYYLSCLNNPAEYCGLLNASKIVMMLMNRTNTSSKDVTFAKFKSLVMAMPYFKQEFPYKRDVITKLIFPNDIEVGFTVASPDNEALGQDFIGGVLDEMNFMEITDKSKKADGKTYDQARDTYNTLSTRITGRFLSTKYIPSTLAVVTSRSSDSDFTAWRLKQLEKEGGKRKQLKEGYSIGATYVSEGDQWGFQPAIKPDGSIRYSGEKFYFAISDGKNPSEIISNNNDPSEVKNREIIEVPVEYRKQFTNDPDRALADIAGRVTKATGRYFASYMKSVYHSIEEFNKFQLQPIFAEHDSPIELWDLDFGFPPINKKYIVLNPYVPRYVHIDLAQTHDRAGFSIAYSPHDMPTKSYEHSYDAELKPKIIYEACIAFVPPEEGKINFEMIRKLIYYLTEKINIPIEYISFDTYQSADMMQILEANDYTVNSISVSGKNSLLAYESLRTAFGEGTIWIPHSASMLKEFRQLVCDGRIVDHPAVDEEGEAGHNDIVDGVCGVHKNIMKHYEEGTLYDFFNYEVLSLYND